MELGRCDQWHPVPPLEQFFQGQGVIGAARLCVNPNFSKDYAFTLVYTETTLFASVSEGQLSSPTHCFQGSVTKPLKELKRLPLLASWQALREGARAAPSCMTLTFHGTTFHHSV